MAIDSFHKALKYKLTMKNSYNGMLKRVEFSSSDEPEIFNSVRY